MIEMHVDESCRACRRLSDELQELALAHRLVWHAPPEAHSHVLVDDGVEYRGHEQMAEHLDELRRLIRQWTGFQSDVCYGLDEEGCCAC